MVSLTERIAVRRARPAGGAAGEYNTRTGTAVAGSFVRSRHALDPPADMVHKVSPIQF
jgi:hypothetical protein